MKISDVDLVERSRFDMSFKYFLDMTPEEEVINPITLIKFREMRLQDVNILDILINKTVEIALDNMYVCKAGHMAIKKVKQGRKRHL